MFIDPELLFSSGSALLLALVAYAFWVDHVRGREQVRTSFDEAAQN